MGFKRGDIVRATKDQKHLLCNEIKTGSCYSVVAGDWLDVLNVFPGIAVVLRCRRSKQTVAMKETDLEFYIPLKETTFNPPLKKQTNCLFVRRAMKIQ